MRTFVVLCAVSVIVLTACTAERPGWTYAPAPSATPLPSVSPSSSAAPSGSAPASESPGASPSGSAPASGSPGASPSGSPGAAVEIAAQNIAFTTPEVTAPADQPFQILFRNQDPSIPHNVEIKDAAGASVFQGEVFNGVDERTYDVPALAAGQYPFICTVHPNMTGTLTAG
jgi:plastocyanin